MSIVLNFLDACASVVRCTVPVRRSLGRHTAVVNQGHRCFDASWNCVSFSGGASSSERREGFAKGGWCSELGRAGWGHRLGPPRHGARSGRWVSTDFRSTLFGTLGCIQIYSYALYLGFGLRMTFT